MKYIKKRERNESFQKQNNKIENFSKIEESSSSLSPDRTKKIKKAREESFLENYSIPKHIKKENNTLHDDYIQIKTEGGVLIKQEENLNEHNRNENKNILNYGVPYMPNKNIMFPHQMPIIPPIQNRMYFDSRVFNFYGNTHQSSNIPLIHNNFSSFHGNRVDFGSNFINTHGYYNHSNSIIIMPLRNQISQTNQYLLDPQRRPWDRQQI